MARRRVTLIVPLVTATLLVQVAATAAPRRFGCGGWDVVSSPVPGYSNVFSDVSGVPGTNFAWAVGHWHSNELTIDQTLTEFWDGVRWRHVPSPNVGQGDLANNYLFGVSARSPTDVWAVGYVSHTAGEDTLIEHWDGVGWSIVPTPDVAKYNSLRAVAAVAADDAWAVGRYLDPGAPTRQRTLIQHWDGAGWGVVPSPNAGFRGDNLLTSVDAISATDRVVAVGSHLAGETNSLVEVWDGGKWRLGPTPFPAEQADGLNGVSALSEDEVWTVGTAADPGEAFFAASARWDGTTWTVIATPQPPEQSNPALDDVSAVSTTDVWAVGSKYNDRAAQLTITEHWDGSAWSIVPSPNPGGTWPGSVTALSAVAAVSLDDVWAVGSYRQGTFDPDNALIMHYCP